MNNKKNKFKDLWIPDTFVGLNLKIYCFNEASQIFFIWGT